MSCCCNNKVEDEEEEELEGPMENRSCTDVIFLILFIVYIIGMIILFGYGVATGDPNRIISGYDVAGDTCGAKNPVLVDVPYSGKDLTGKGLLFIDLVRTAQIQGDATLSLYLKNLSLPNTDLTSTLVDKIQFCLEGMNLGGSVNTTSRRKRETILSDSALSSAHHEYVPIVSRLLDNSTEIVLLLGQDSSFKIYKTSKLILDPSTASKELLSYDPVTTALTGGGSCRYCLQACPNGYKVFLDRCIPDFVENTAGGLFAGSGAQSFVNDVVSDFKTCSDLLLALSAIALVLSLLMTIAFRLLAKVIVYVIIGVVVVGCIAGTVLLWVLWYLKDQDIKLQAAEESKPNNQSAIMNTTEQITRNFLGSSTQANSQAEVNYFLAGAIIATVVTVVILLILLVLRKRIQLVVQLFKEAGAAVHAMPLLVLAPFVTVVLQAIIGVSWIYGTLWIESSGYPQKVNSTGFITYTKDLTILWMRWYHIFGLLWMTQFVVAAQHLVIAGSVAGWYFSKDKSSVGVQTILGSVWRLVRYHLGTVAFGSFIIALIQLIRIILNYIESRVKKWEKNGLGGPLVHVLVIILKCLQCCMACFERFMKYINVNAYIETAIYGYNFCRAAIKAFQLLTSNALRVAAINSVGTFVLLLGKLSVVIATVLIGMQLIKNKTGGENGVYINHPWAPLLLAAIFAYIIAHAFISVYSMAIDTIFLCFCEDCARNDGINKPYFMSRGLMEFAENSSKALDALEKRKKNENKVLVSENSDFPSVEE